MVNERLSEFSPGATVCGFQVRAALGEGGMGGVFEAFDPWVNRVVALKVPSRPEADAALRLEAQALAAIGGPLVPAVFALLEHRGYPVLVMERVYGAVLETVLERQRARGTLLTLDEVLDILGTLADGLVSVHRAGVAHRDIKPGNIILAPANRTVLLDFGVVLPAVSSQGAAIAGTPLYMAPEQLLGQVEPQEVHLLDTYALGVLAWEMLTGRPPFEGTVEQVVAAHVASPVPDIRAVRPDLPIKLAALVGSLLAKSPGERPASMEIVAWQVRSVRAAQARADHVGFSVLVVDDDKDTSDLLQVFVREAAPDCELRIARDGEEALALVRARPPHLMFLDLNLPRLSGLEVAMALRGTRLAEACSIVPISGAASADDKKLLRDLGLTRFVQKDMAAHDRIVGIVADELNAWGRRRRLQSGSGLIPIGTPAR